MAGGGSARPSQRQSTGGSARPDAGHGDDAAASRRRVARRIRPESWPASSLVVGSGAAGPDGGLLSCSRLLGRPQTPGAEPPGWHRARTPPPRRSGRQRPGRPLHPWPSRGGRRSRGRARSPWTTTPRPSSWAARPRPCSAIRASTSGGVTIGGSLGIGPAALHHAGRRTRPDGPLVGRPVPVGGDLVEGSEQLCLGGRHRPVGVRRLLVGDSLGQVEQLPERPQQEPPIGPVQAHQVHPLGPDQPGPAAHDRG